MPSNEQQSLDELEEQFDAFLMEMSESLQALQDDVAALHRPELLPLDYSYESIDRLETMYGLALDGGVKIPVDSDILATRVARYLGETLRLHIGGKWDFGHAPKDINYGMPCLTKIPKLPKSYAFYPLVVAAGYRKSRRPGWMRARVERHDSERRSQSFAAFLAEMDAELAALDQYVRASAPHEQPLDYSIESLDRVEQVLRQALDGAIGAPDGIDRLAMRIARYMGETYRRLVGGTWQLCENPRDIDFGLPKIDFFSPIQIVENFRVHRPAGLLRSATQSSVAAARRKAERG